MDCHFLLQETFPTQGLKPGLLHSRQDALPSDPPGKPNDRRSSLKYNLKKVAFSYKCILETKPLKQDLNSPKTMLPLPRFSVDLMLINK